MCEGGGAATAEGVGGACRPRANVLARRTVGNAGACNRYYTNTTHTHHITHHITNRPSTARASPRALTLPTANSLLTTAPSIARAPAQPPIGPAVHAPAPAVPWSLVPRIERPALGHTHTAREPKKPRRAEERTAPPAPSSSRSARDVDAPRDRQRGQRCGRGRGQPAAAIPDQNVSFIGRGCDGGAGRGGCRLPFAPHPPLALRTRTHSASRLPIHNTTQPHSYDLVDDPATDPIVSWTEDGRR